MEEFFQQGDREKEGGLDFSPLCDRSVTTIGGVLPAGGQGEGRWSRLLAPL